jgi:hypothetical protein
MWFDKLPPPPPPVSLKRHLIPNWASQGKPKPRGWSCILWTRTSYRWSYGACALHAGYLRFQTQNKQVICTFRSPTTAIVARTHHSVMLCAHCLSSCLVHFVFLPNAAIKLLALLVRVGRYRTQTSDQTPGILHESHRGFPQPIQICDTVLRIVSRPSPWTFPPVHFSLIILLFNAALLNLFKKCR